MTDAVAALGTYVVALLFWWWVCPRETVVSAHPGSALGFGGDTWTILSAPGIAVPAFFAIVLAASLVYFARGDIKLRPMVIVGAVTIMIGALPFAFFAFTPILFPLFCLDLAATVLWYGLAAGTLAARRPGVELLIDAINQGLCVPFRNFGAFFAQARALFKNHQRTSQVVVALVGLLIALPVMILVVALLASADQGFNDLIGSVVQAFANVSVWGYIWRVIVAIPTAMYLFGVVWGNVHRVKVDTWTRQRAKSAAHAIRRVSLTAIGAPLIVLTAIYILFFVAMSAYLFSAFSGQLPGGFTYADYARRGFFELSGVAAINAAVLGFTYLFTKRETTYPMFLRVVGATLSGLTLLLIATAESKMILYISAYGLTQLRFFVGVFMAMMALIFVLVGVWHVHPFRVSGPILIIGVVTLLGLAWCNPDGLIARYNVDAYIDGRIATVDVNYLASLHEAALPALLDLSELARDQATVDAVNRALTSDVTIYGIPLDCDTSPPWTSWNLQSHLMEDEARGR